MRFRGLKRWLWPGAVAILLLVNLALSGAYFKQRALADTLLFERALQVHAALHVASIEIRGVTSPDAPDAPSRIQGIIRHLTDAEAASDQLYLRRVITTSPEDLRTMPRYIQRIRQQLENMVWSHDYSALPDVNGAVEGLAAYLDNGLRSYGPQDKTAYLEQFGSIVEAYRSPYPGLQ